MNKIIHYIGLDVHKNSIAVNLLVRRVFPTLTSTIHGPTLHKVSGGSQPPVASDSDLGETAGSRPLHRLVRFLT